MKFERGSEKEREKQRVNDRFKPVTVRTQICVYMNISLYMYMNYDYQMGRVSLRLSVIGRISGITE